MVTLANEKKPPNVYLSKNKIRIVTAGSLFDGHDVAINIMRRIMQSSGCEVIHLGHNRSAEDIVNCAIQEDVQAISITSYQGGHVEFFKYVYDLLKQKGRGNIKVFGGGGGTILPNEIEELHKHGIARIYSPDDGRKMGLQGMINDLLSKCDFSLDRNKKLAVNGHEVRLDRELARLITLAENNPEIADKNINAESRNSPPVIGITGTGGSGKSTLVDELVRRFLNAYKDQRLAIVSVDPSKRKTGGALLGDRIRMNSIYSDRIYMRSLATRQHNRSLSRQIKIVLDILKMSAFDLIIIETSGIGQSDSGIVDISDISLYVMTPEYGAASQLEKIDMMDYADIVVVNKSDKKEALDSIKDVKRQYQRNHQLWDIDIDELPVFGIIASQFNNEGTNHLFEYLMRLIDEKTNLPWLRQRFEKPQASQNISTIIPSNRIRYLSEISTQIREYNERVIQQGKLAQELYAINLTLSLVEGEGKEQIDILLGKREEIVKQIDLNNLFHLENWEKKISGYKSEVFEYQVREKKIMVSTVFQTLSGTKISKVMLPKYEAWGDILRWILQENVPGEFPYTSGVFKFKRKEEDPTRMFAGEGGPERTNKRFLYLSKGQPAQRLSTAFDSVTLYGENPGFRPDIYGKIGNSGVSIACLDDMKKLYAGFDLSASTTSISMTINGPASIICAYFMNVAIDQQCEKYIIKNGLLEETNKKIKEIFKEKKSKKPVYHGELPEGNNGLGLLLLGLTGDQVLPRDVYDDVKHQTLAKVRGTVQSDILKEDQAQNTCIFSVEFSLKIMGDMQAYFIDNSIRNFYSVSISGYHIAEAGANPITQLAFTLANGFTFVEYYLSRGMKIDDFAPNLSFFFSNGVDAEYAVIGRVARRIWAKTMKEKYCANERSQKLKYHIQTSGRSLHAQEIDFNDIRTTLQALYAIYDNCNSLHTNAYDEAITTPTEESVRRAMAIQLIINKELGLAKNENSIQGSFIIEDLTNLVEEAVLVEFDRITERGGVLGAMEKMYQRGKIQDESMKYEHLKHTGELPIVGVNTFLSSTGSATVIPSEVIRATREEKERQISNLQAFHKRNEKESKKMLKSLKLCASNNQNIFESLMEVSKYCSLGEITDCLFESGGQYRRNM